MTAGSSSTPDPYAALGVAKDATLEQIRSAHRKLVLKAHPDRFPSASPDEKQQKADQFHKIQQAYELLSDANERQKYDRVQEMKADLFREREAFKERRSTRSQPGSQDYSSNVYPSYHEPRAEPVFEVRVPRGTPKKYEDEPLHAQYDSSTRYEEPYRSSPRTRNEEFKGSSRRTSARDYFEDERKREENEAKIKRRQAAKDETNKARKANDKSREKARKEFSDLKASSYYSPKIGAESDESESDDYSVKYSKKKPEASSKRRSDEPKKSARSRRSREEYVTEDSDDMRSHDHYQRQTTNRQREAEEYMKSMRTSKNASDQDDNPRSRHRRAAERPPTAPSPPPAPKDKAEATSRSTRKTRDLSPRDTPSRSHKDKPIEIVEEAAKTSRRSGHDSTRRPTLKVSESAPPGSAEFQIPARAHTMQMPMREREMNAPRRSQTSNNMEQMGTPRGRDRLSDRERDRTPPPEKTRRREFSSPVGEDRNGYVFESPAAAAASTSTRYRIYDGTDDESGKVNTPRIVNIEPLGANDRRTSRPPAQRTMSRETSPLRRSSTRSGPRPAGLGISRASTFQEGSRYIPVEPNSPRLGRAFTARAGSAGNEEMFFADVPRDAGPRPGVGRSPSNMSQFNKDEVYWSPPIALGDVRWSASPGGGGGGGGGGGVGGSRRDKEGDRDGKYTDRGKESPREGSKKEKKSGSGGEPFATRDGTMGRHGASSLRQTVRT